MEFVFTYTGQDYFVVCKYIVQCEVAFPTIKKSSSSHLAGNNLTPSLLTPNLFPSIKTKIPLYPMIPCHQQLILVFCTYLG